MGRIAALLVTLAALALAAPAGAETVTFRMPSGNIGCYLIDGTLRCDILQKTYRSPKRPASCELDWGDAFEMNARGKMHLVCHGDTAVDQRARVLRYGTTWKRGGFTCTSRTTGLRCSNRSGHGWEISKGRLRTF